MKFSYARRTAAENEENGEEITNLINERMKFINSQLVTCNFIPHINGVFEKKCFEKCNIQLSL